MIRVTQYTIEYAGDDAPSPYATLDKIGTPDGVRWSCSVTARPVSAGTEGAAMRLASARIRALADTLDESARMIEGGVINCDDPDDYAREPSDTNDTSDAYEVRDSRSSGTVSGVILTDDHPAVATTEVVTIEAAVANVNNVIRPDVADWSLR